MPCLARADTIPCKGFVSRLCLGPRLSLCLCLYHLPLSLSLFSCGAVLYCFVFASSYLESSLAFFCIVWFCLVFGIDVVLLTCRGIDVVLSCLLLPYLVLRCLVFNLVWSLPSSSSCIDCLVIGLFCLVLKATLANGSKRWGR